MATAADEIIRRLPNTLVRLDDAHEQGHELGHLPSHCARLKPQLTLGKPRCQGFPEDSLLTRGPWHAVGEG